MPEDNDFPKCIKSESLTLPPPPDTPPPELPSPDEEFKITFSEEDKDINIRQNDSNSSYSRLSMLPLPDFGIDFLGEDENINIDVARRNQSDFSTATHSAT